VDETANVASREQLNLTIRYINNDYIISEDSIGLFSLPDTTAKTLHAVVKDQLCVVTYLCYSAEDRLMMEHQLCKEKERTCDYLSTALPVHCLAHLLNLCLQDAARQVELLRDAMDVVREIVGLIKLSPKRTIFK